MANTIKPVIKKLGKYSLLLTIKESYLLSKNVLGLFFHPFKTLKEITDDKDYSQVFLIITLPFYLILFGIIFIISGRFLIKAPIKWGILAKGLLALIFLTSFLLFCYLAYWFWQIKKYSKIKFKNKLKQT
jgi:amino acid permease